MKPATTIGIAVNFICAFTIKDVYLYLLLGFAVVIFVIMCFYKLNSKNYDRIVSELERSHYHPNAKYTPFSEA